MTSENNNGWISVKHRLPKIECRYRVKSSTGFETDLNFSNEHGWFERKKDDYWNRFITHWMPLLEYKKEAL